MRLPCFVALALSASCTVPDVPFYSCDEIADPTGEVVTPASGTRVIGDEVLVRGRIASERAVLDVRLLGLPVSSEQGDFHDWSISLPLASLRAVGTNPVVADVVVDTVCTEDLVVGSVELLLPREAQATGLEMVLTSPEHCFLPADGSDVARVDLCADPSAVDAVVNFVAANGELLQVEGDLATLSVVTNDACDPGDATTSSFLRASQAGTVRVYASGPGAVPQDLDLPAAGAPGFSAAALEVPSGATRQVILSTNGAIDTCTWATANPGDFAAVSIDDVAFDEVFSFDPASANCAGFARDPARVVQVAAAPGAGPATATLTCEDPYGQRSVLTVTIPDV